MLHSIMCPKKVTAINDQLTSREPVYLELPRYSDTTPSPQEFARNRNTGARAGAKVKAAPQS